MTTAVSFHRLSLGALLTLLVLSATPSLANAQLHEFNVPAQPATTGVPEFARQADERGQAL